MFTWSPLCMLIFLCSSVIASENVNAQVTTECPSDSYDEFPTDVFNKEQRAQGAIVFHFLVLVYCFLIVSYVCQDYFLPAIFCICHDLEITPDVAAATFMASATSFPEMSVNVIATFITNSDLGIGTIVGGSVCNTLGVAAVAGLATRRSIKLEKWSMLRDSIIHLFVLIVLTLIVLDGVIVWSEALILVILYFVYFTIMLSHKRILSYVRNHGSLASLLCWTNMYKYRIDDQKIVTICELTENKWKMGESIENVAPVCEKTEPKLEGNTNKKNKSRGIWSWITLPIDVVLSLTIPDCKKTHTVYPITFIMSVVWIGASSYLVCWMVTVIGDTFSIPDVVMGMLFLAVGGSVPEATSAFINSRNDRGTMSISNTLGANTLDILLSLGVPWFIKCMLPASCGGGPIRLSTSDLPFNCVGLILSVILLNVISASTGYKMNRIFGSCCLLSYMCVSGLFIVVGMGFVSFFGVENSQCTD